MRRVRNSLLILAMSIVFGSSAFCQTSSVDPGRVSAATPTPTLAFQSGEATSQLFDFRESEIKFSVASLMAILRDGRHEGWVLAAYPDPKTHRPLIGAGFSLDLPAREHPQRDPLNPHPFVEPSSAQLWQEAGLEPERLQRILDRYDRDLKTWTAKRFRRKIRARTLTPEVTDDEATRLLRISAIQAISNARAYCLGFDRLTASQQMALSQMVFQMGVNLEEFVRFLDTLNSGTSSPETAQGHGPAESGDPEHWRTVQRMLIESQWARLYSRRASTVIAMFDPAYSEDPSGALQRVDAVLRPVAHRRKGGSSSALRVASYSRSAGKSPRNRVHGSRRKRKAS